jgi:hypothetical protein
MANKQKADTFKLSNSDGRKWETTDRTEVVNLRARGWRIDSAPDVESAPAQVPATPPASGSGK